MDSPEQVSPGLVGPSKPQSPGIVCPPQTTGANSPPWVQSLGQVQNDSPRLQPRKRQKRPLPPTREKSSRKGTKVVPFQAYLAQTPIVLKVTLCSFQLGLCTLCCYGTWMAWFNRPTLSQPDYAKKDIFPFLYMLSSLAHYALSQHDASVKEDCYATSLSGPY